MVVLGSSVRDNESKKFVIRRDGRLAVAVDSLDFGGFSIPVYDDIVLSYDGDDNLSSVVYKKDGSTLATLTMSYDSNGNLIEVNKS